MVMREVKVVEFSARIEALKRDLLELKDACKKRDFSSSLYPQITLEDFNRFTAQVLSALEVNAIMTKLSPDHDFLEIYYHKRMKIRSKCC
jgi:hypothetical protein